MICYTYEQQIILSKPTLSATRGTIANVAVDIQMKKTLQTSQVLKHVSADLNCFERKLMAKFRFFYFYCSSRSFFSVYFKCYFVLIFKDIIILDLVSTIRQQNFGFIIFIIEIELSISYEISYTCT